MRIFRSMQKPITDEQKKAFSDSFEENKVGFKDKLAMIFTATYMIVLPCALILTAFGLLCLWLFGAL